MTTSGLFKLIFENYTLWKINVLLYKEYTCTGKNIYSAIG